MNDTISRQAAIDTIVNTPTDVYSHDRIVSVLDGAAFRQNEIIDILNALPSAQQWIPVSERLPIPNSVYESVSVYYLVQNEYGDMMVATFIQFPGGARVWQQMYQDGAIMEDIVAWMPLPEPWKGGEDETLER